MFAPAAGVLSSLLSLPRAPCPMPTAQAGTRRSPHVGPLVYVSHVDHACAPAHPTWSSGHWPWHCFWHRRLTSNGPIRRATGFHRVDLWARDFHSSPAWAAPPRDSASTQPGWSHQPSTPRVAKLEPRQQGALESRRPRPALFAARSFDVVKYRSRPTDNTCPSLHIVVLVCPGSFEIPDLETRII